MEKHCQDCDAFYKVPDGKVGYCNREAAKRYVNKISHKKGGFFSKLAKACKHHTIRTK